MFMLQLGRSYKEMFLVWRSFPSDFGHVHVDFGFKLLEKLNFDEGLDLGFVLKNNPQEEGPWFCHRGPLPFVLFLSLSPYSLFPFPGLDVVYNLGYLYVMLCMCDDSDSCRCQHRNAQHLFHGLGRLFIVITYNNFLYSHIYWYFNRYQNLFHPLPFHLAPLSYLKKLQHLN
jgi:hypothetical protein